MRKLWGLAGVLMVLGGVWLTASASASAPSASVTAELNSDGTVTYTIVNTGPTGSPAIGSIHAVLNTGKPPPTVTKVTSSSGSWSWSPGQGDGNPPNTVDGVGSLAPGESVEITVSTSPSGYKGTTSFTFTDTNNNKSSVDNVPTSTNPCSADPLPHACRFNLAVSLELPKTEVSHKATHVRGVVVVKNLGPKISPHSEAVVEARMYYVSDENNDKDTEFLGDAKLTPLASACAWGDRVITCQVPGLPKGHEKTYAFRVSLTSDQVKDARPNEFRFTSEVGAPDGECNGAFEVTCQNNDSEESVTITR